MAADADGYLDDRVVKAPARERLGELTLGSKLVIGAATLVLLSLFFTWQNVELNFGPTRTGTQPLDGWDVFGLMIALVAVALVALVIVVRASNVEVSPDIDWDRVVLLLAAALLGLVLVKNLTDRDSAWVSYLVIAFAATAVVGAYLDWSGWESRRRPVRRRRRRRRRR
jgi:hypothetical protein